MNITKAILDDYLKILHQELRVTKLPDSLEHVKYQGLGVIMFFFKMHVIDDVDVKIFREQLLKVSEETLNTLEA